MAHQEHHQVLQGKACIVNKDFSEAIVHFNKAIFLFPDEAELYMLRGEAYIDCFDVASATANFKRAIQLSTQKELISAMADRLVEVLDAQGCYAFYSGNYMKALECFSDALHFNKHSVVSVFHRGLTRLMLRMNAAAVADFHSCAVEAYVSPYQFVALAVVALQQLNFKEALSCIQRGLPGNEATSIIQNIQSFFQQLFRRSQAQAETLLLEEKAEDAGRILDELIDCSSAATPELYRLRSTCLSKLGLYSAAVQDLFECISKSGGSNPVAEKQLASTLLIVADELVNENLGQALEYYSEAIKWNPTLCDSYVQRGVCYHKLKEHENALSDFKKALQIDSKSEFARLKLGLLYDEWGIVLFNQKNVVAAEAEFTKAVDCCDLPIFYFHRARCRLADASSHSGAIQDLQCCLDLQTDSPEILKLAHQFCNKVSAMKATNTISEMQHVISKSGIPLYTIVKGDMDISRGRRKVIVPRRLPKLESQKEVDNANKTVLSLRENFQLAHCGFRDDGNSQKGTEASILRRMANHSENIWRSSLPRTRSNNSGYYGGKLHASSPFSVLLDKSQNEDDSFSSVNGKNSVAAFSPMSIAAGGVAAQRVSRLHRPCLSLRDLRSLNPSIKPNDSSDNSLLPHSCVVPE